MLLAIDVGNTHTVLGLFENGDLKRHWRILTDRQRTADEYSVMLWNLHRMAEIDPRSIDGAIICNVVPPLLAVVEETCRATFDLRPLVVGPGTKTGMPILYDNPREVGADRIVNAVAAYERHRDLSIVVDFGTATTFDAITRRGEYLGGAIAPGLSIAAEALFQRAARLPRVDIRRPPRVVGRNTTHSLQSGLFFGYLGLVQGILSRMREELGEPVRTLGTGGLSQALHAELEGLLDEVDPNLTLEGLRLLYDRNR
jgi:type III pantothenate kinase